jgi:uncharacterized protein involved in response to NO
MTALSTTARLPAALTIFAYGFRPFFLLAGLHASLSMLTWVGVLQGWVAAPAGWPPAMLHGHEMIFGFASAALAGFLLTAVPSWTKAGPLRGWRLALLVLLWLSGRAAAAAGADPVLYAALDLAFLPGLAACIAPGILRASAKRKAIVLAILAAIWVANLGTHLTTLGAGFVSARWGNEFGLALFVLLIAIIGGRLIPPFTIGGMRMAGRPVDIAAARRLDRAVLATTAAWAASLALDLPDAAVAVAAALAALANGARFVRWRTLETLRIPLVWVLHLGYVWVVFGLLAASAGWMDWLPRASALHALGAGAVGTMVLAVMSRASLGHTGRKLEAGTPITLAYALVAMGALLRVLATVITDSTAEAMIPLSGALWAGGYALFCIVYTPILIRPRADGRPG